MVCICHISLLLTITSYGIEKFFLSLIFDIRIYVFLEFWITEMAKCNIYYKEEVQ